jgi:hypothetical protein
MCFECIIPTVKLQFTILYTYFKWWILRIPHSLIYCYMLLASWEITTFSDGYSQHLERWEKCIYMGHSHFLASHCFLFMWKGEDCMIFCWWTLVGKTLTLCEWPLNSNIYLVATTVHLAKLIGLQWVDYVSWLCEKEKYNHIPFRKGRHAVALLVEALWCKPESCVCESCWGHWIFQLT